MDSYADAVAHRASIASAVANRTMPPWPPNDSCNTYQHDRSLSEAQRNTLLAWATGEAPEGSPASYVPPAEGAAVALKIDRSIGAAAPYVPAISPDEYRCFVIDWNETNTKYVTGLRVTPGAISEVHHAIVFQIAPQDVAAVQKLDDADPAAGYSCFGTPGVDGAGWVGAWVPGSTGEVFPADTGIAIVPGSKLVVQMHYNTANTPPVPDRSTVDLQLADTVKTEAAVLKWTNPSWVFNHTMSIAAGDADSVQQFSFAPTNFMVKASGGALKNGLPFSIWSAALHMHARGVKASLHVEHADGTRECALQIDDWSFHWQGTYALQKPILVQPGDKLSIECHFDNSGKRQPTIGGQGAPVGPVNWGETTEDEMCLGLFYATQ